mmetsp:Transcript_59009/g.175565  ORF Transcript_59009/g.175565 Transcript_59009/m.175565 type:complete len:199 (-) Transcript_59009:49-645(-)
MAAEGVEAGISRTGPLPELVVFDLDACLWDPEMYQLRDPDGPFEFDKGRNVAVASSGEEVHLLGHTPAVFTELATAPCWKSSRVAVASCCDAPDSARFLLGAFLMADGSRPLGDILSWVEIRFGSKREHFRRIQRESGIPFQKMLFFDDQFGNCREVADLGVVTQRTPLGLTKDAWEEGLHRFAAAASGRPLAANGRM